ncbi:hypothetical protein NQ117_14040 [Paenibacillus sp. SC116]|uniref:hypothetical protein n=1 Tax=Paenibacillus sp. SC116 TaxID=2968986 RepID=UPI00215ADF3F|nr:hypothetical protein [Paenibacillus sp. SC116]MCR8844808.1 hypothetical protein [Paenibacillus sp. SC116]
MIVLELLGQLKMYYASILEASSPYDVYEQISIQIDECYGELSQNNIRSEHRDSLLEIQHLHHRVIDVIQLEQSKLREKMTLLDKKQAANHQYQRYQAVQESVFLDRRQ